MIQQSHQEVLPMSNKIIEGLWDCPYCDQKGIGGLTKQCPNCGHPQDEGTVFYLPSKKEYLDKETADQYGKGADWICSFCDSLNRYYDDVCTNCGASREESSGDYFSNKTEEAKDSVAEKDVYGTASGTSGSASEDVGADHSEDPVYQQYRKEAREQQQEKRRKQAQKEKEEREKIQAQRRQSSAKLFAGIGLILILALLFMFWPRTSKATLDSKSWVRDITIEELKAVQESAWSVPDGGRVYETQDEIHHYDQVLDHYENVLVPHYRQVLDGYDTSIEYVSNGDGTFSERTVSTPRYRTETYYVTVQEPVYQNVPNYQPKYYYEIDRWVESRHVTTRGGPEDPYWGDAGLAGNEREGVRQAAYTLTFKEKRKSYSIDVNEEYWRSLKTGTSVKLTTSNGQIIKINGASLQ